MPGERQMCSSWVTMEMKCQVIIRGGDGWEFYKMRVWEGQGRARSFVSGDEDGFAPRVNRVMSPEASAWSLSVYSLGLVLFRSSPW